MSDKLKNSIKEEKEQKPVDEVKKSEWGNMPEDNFGYASDEERRQKRGLEDWEMVENIPDSQEGVPRWFFGVIFVVLLMAIGLSFPFWGDRPGYEREWINWGFGAAILYLAVFGTFVYYMVTFYGSKVAGRLDSDKNKEKDTSVDTASEGTQSQRSGSDSNSGSKDESFPK
jgi:hypothetical protein